MAKQGAESGTLIRLERSLTSIKSALKKRMLAAWNNEWNKLVDCRQSRKLISYNPNKKHANYLLKRGRNSCRKTNSPDDRA